MSRIAAARIIAGPSRISASSIASPRAHRLLSTASCRTFTSQRAPRLRAVAPIVPAPASRRSFHASNPSLGIFHFKLADIGEGITEVEIIKWHVTDGQEVEEFDSLCEVQSDKSVVEITSPHAGKVTNLSAEPGSVVKVGQTLCDIDRPDFAGEAEEPVEAAPAAPAPAPVREEPKPAPAAPAPAAEAPAQPKRQGKPHPLADEETRVRFEGEAGILPAAPRQDLGWVPETVEARRDSTAGAKTIVKTSPAVRNLASRLGVDLNSVSPSGPNGRVVKEDVERAAAAAAAPAPKAAPAAAPRAAAPAPKTAAPVFVPSADRGEATERMAFGRTRKVMYKAMGSQGDVPHFGYQHTLDLTNLLPLMRAANPSPEPKAGYIASDIPGSLVHAAPVPERTKTSVLPFLVKALALALEEHPIMRSRVREVDGERMLDVARDASIGIAVSDPKMGLLTPSLPAVDPTSAVSTINEQLNALRLSPAKPGPAPHITLSSVGPLGEARGAMPVLPPGGGLAIAAVGRAAWEVEWSLKNGAPGRGVWNLAPEEVQAGGTRAVLRCPVGWSGDHRVLEGAELIAFTETWKRYVEEPWRWLQV